MASNGPHAEFVSVPANLCAKIPDNVSDEAAAFTVIGAIGLQGIRLAKPELGETFVVIGLGLIGQIAGQLLRAHGCRVIGFDFDPAKVAMARTFGILAVQAGAEVDPVKWVLHQTGGLGADGVLITASTSSHEVIAQSARMSRKRGRIVLIGVVGLNINRADFYEKELTFQVSCSYGPGRYDDAYEEKGYDYPPAYVRWTENRNFQAVLQMMSTGALQVEPLITRRVPLENFREIYDHMDDGGLASLLVYGGGSELSKGSELSEGTAGRDQRLVMSDRVLSQPSGANPQPLVGNPQSAIPHRQSPVANLQFPFPASTIRVCDREVGSNALAIIGSGNFTKMTAMPALAEAKAPVKVVVSSGGVTGTSLAKKYRVPFSSTDYAAVLADAEVRGVIITTRHNLHAEQVIAALRAGKHVLVEKPLCLTLGELREIDRVMAATLQSSRAVVAGSNQSSKLSGQLGPAARRQETDNRTSEADGRAPGYRSASINPEASPTHSLTPPTPPLLSHATLTVGYNRRFSPHVEKMKALLKEGAGPVSIVATMNAGAIPLSHWVHDPEVGGGRIVGEACHFVDLAIHLTGSLIVEVSATQLEGSPDCASILLRHANGSTAVVNYFAHGNREVSKERVEVHSLGRTLLLDNFRELRGYGFKSFSKLKTRLDKGHARQFALFARQVQEGGPPLIPWAEIRNGTQAIFAAQQAMQERRVVEVGEIG